MERESVESMISQLRTHWPEFCSRPIEITMRFARLNSLIRERNLKKIKAAGLNESGFEVLVILRSSPPPYQRTPTELCRNALMTSGGMTRNLDVLESKGLILRVDNGDDRRVKPVQLTALGLETVESVATDIVQNDQAMMSRGLTSDQDEKLSEILRIWLAAWE